MGRLFLMTREFNIVIQPQLMLFQKTYLSLEGLTRMLSPELNIPDTVRPILENWVKNRYTLSSIGKKIKDEFPHWISDSPDLPRLIHTVLTDMHHQQIRERSIRNTGVSTGANQLYRSLFFLVIGFIALLAPLIEWLISGFSPLGILLIFIGAVCLSEAWPRRNT